MEDSGGKKQEWIVRLVLTKQQKIAPAPMTRSDFLITGCAGFIGSRVVRILLDSGHRVIGIDNLNDDYNVRLKQHRLKLLRDPNFAFTKLDIENSSEVDDLFSGHRFGAVINLAARTGVRRSVHQPLTYLRTNTIGSLNLLEAMRRHNANKYVLASTSSLYSGQSLPFSESTSADLPYSPYAASKKSAEVMAHAYHHLHEIDVSILRLFSVYGPAGRPDMSILRFISKIYEGRPLQIYGNGHQKRDLTYVDDIAMGIISALRPVGYEITNLGTGRAPVSVLELVSKIESLLNKKARMEFRDSDPADMFATSSNVSKAKRILGWEAKTSIDDGLRASVRWFLDNLPWSATIVSEDN